jgi:tetratricopeptide (TPR) repeat protein
MPLMLHQRARQRLQAIDGDEAWNRAGLIAELERLLLSYPDFAAAHEKLAAAHEEAGDETAALRCRLAAISRNPYDGDLWVKLAEFHYRRRKQPRDAIQALKQALKIDLQHPAALALLAEIERERNPAAPAAR